METYIKEPIKINKEMEAQEAGPVVDTLHRDFAAFVGSYLKELALALGYSRMDKLSVEMDDINFKMVKKRGRRKSTTVSLSDTVTVSDNTGEERIMKPVISKYLGILRLYNEKKIPYVRVGDKVQKGQILARVETMNIRNDILAGRSGVIAEIMEEDGKPVEYGQIVMFLEID